MQAFEGSNDEIEAFFLQEEISADKIKYNSVDSNMTITIQFNAPRSYLITTDQTDGLVLQLPEKQTNEGGITIGGNPVNLDNNMALIVEGQYATTLDQDKWVCKLGSKSVAWCYPTGIPFVVRWGYKGYGSYLFACFIIAMFIQGHVYDSLGCAALWKEFQKGDHASRRK